MDHTTSSSGPSGTVPTSLAAFIEENQRVITVLGVFTALTVFASNLRPVEFGQFLSSLFLTLTTLIWLELWGRFPSGGGSWRLSWFENMLSMTVLVLVGYWVVVVHTWVHDLITILVFGLTLGGLSQAMSRWNLFNRVFRSVPHERTKLRYGLGILIQVVVFAASFFVASVAGPPVDRFLDRISAEFSKAK